MHEPEDRMDLVVVEVQAPAVAWPQVQVFGLPVAYDVIRQARLNGREDADQALLDAVLPGNRPGAIFLADGARRQV